MIISEKEHLSRYYGLNKNLDCALSFIEKEDLAQLPLGKTEITKDVFVVVFQYEADNELNAFFEGHKDYLDIHMVTEGVEKMACIEEKYTKILKPFSQTEDIGLFTGAATTECLLQEGKCLIVFPEDLHQPKVRVNDRGVRKIVFKVKL